MMTISTDIGGNNDRAPATTTENRDRRNPANPTKFNLKLNEFQNPMCGIILFMSINPVANLLCVDNVAHPISDTLTTHLMFTLMLIYRHSTRFQFGSIEQQRR